MSLKDMRNWYSRANNFLTLAVVLLERSLKFRHSGHKSSHKFSNSDKLLIPWIYHFLHFY
jgi:hypothetical protein